MSQTHVKEPNKTGSGKSNTRCRSTQAHGQDMVNGQAVADKLSFAGQDYLNLNEQAGPTVGGGSGLTVPDDGGGGGTSVIKPPVDTIGGSPQSGLSPVSPTVTEPVTPPSTVVAPPAAPLSAPQASPQPPVASAGASQTITLPTSSVTLDATGSSDPQDSQLTFVWGLISSPQGAPDPIIVNSVTPITTVTGLVAGSYQFQVTVFNALGLHSTANVSVDVLPASGAVVNTGTSTINSGSVVIATTAPLSPSGTGPLGGLGGGGGGGGGGSDDSTPAQPESWWQRVMDVAKANWLLLALAAAAVGVVLMDNKKK